MRLCAIADLHGHLPDIPDCDVLAIAGDISQAFKPENEVFAWWASEFKDWLTGINERGINTLAVGGNHDFILQNNLELVKRLNLPWTYLEDSGVAIWGINFYGTPWQPWFGGWAFNAPEHDVNEEFLNEKFDQIPDNTDVLISHGPPTGILDEAGPGNHAGSRALNWACQRVTPKLTVFGHIHYSYGVEKVEGCTFANVAQTDSKYRLVNKPICFDI